MSFFPRYFFILLLLSSMALGRVGASQQQINQVADSERTASSFQITTSPMLVSYQASYSNVGYDSADHIDPALKSNQISWGRVPSSKNLEHTHESLGTYDAALGEEGLTLLFGMIVAVEGSMKPIYFFDETGENFQTGPTAISDMDISSRTTGTAIPSGALLTSSETRTLDALRTSEIGSLNGILVQQVSPTRAAGTTPKPFNLEAKILERHFDFSPYTLSFLISPETKQKFTKNEHEQVVQELQGKYSQEAHPELAQKIATWKQAVHGWSVCSDPKEKESRYEQVKTLASDMPPKLYRLVALSQAMKIMEDAVAYSYYLPRALKKYDTDAKIQGTEQAKVDAARSQALLLGKVDIISNHIKNLGEVADAVIELSKQKDRCLTAAASTAAQNPEIANQFNAAAQESQQAIDDYLQYGQKMREGDVPAASQLRFSGREHECQALHEEYKAYQAQALARGDHLQAENFSKAANSSGLANTWLMDLCRSKKLGATEAVKACEQAIQYTLQAAQAFANGDSLQAENFSKATYKAINAGSHLVDAPQYRRSGDVEVLKVLKQAGHYWLQAAQAYANGDSHQAENFSKAAENARNAFYFFLKNDFPVSSVFMDVPHFSELAAYRKSGNVEALKALEQAGHYYLQATQAYANGDSHQAENFSKAADDTFIATKAADDAF